ncbi:MAG: response regulator [Thermoguttaceae bacterium]
MLQAVFDQLSQISDTKLLIPSTDSLKMKTFKILFVEDDANFRVPYAQQLRDNGFEVVEAEGETPAAELLKKETFDLAVVDLVMEQADGGFTLSYHIKKDFPNMPVILITGINSEMGLSFSTESASERSWIKADAFLNKPLRFEQLLYEIQRLLGCLEVPSHH